MKTDISEGRRHDFRVFKESGALIAQRVSILADTGYQGIQKIHANSSTPIKKRKGRELSEEDKRFNKLNASKRVTIENVIGALKRFRIISDRYRNRRRRFGLRLNLIAGLYNYEL